MALCRYFLCLLLATSVRSQNDSTPLNVIQVAQNLGLNTFVQLLTENGVADEWASAGEINVFGPTDGAIETAQNAGLIPSDPEDLRDLLVFHGVDGTQAGGILSTQNFQNDVLVQSLYPPGYVRLNVYNNPEETIYSAMGCKVDNNQANNNASNGIVQVIVSVMVPPIYSLNGLLNSNGNFSNFTRAINLAGLSELLQGAGNFTILAPTDAAFAKLSPDYVDDLFSDPDALANLVNYHLVGSTYYSEGIYDGLSLTTLQGGSIFFTVHGDPRPGAYANDVARLIYLDLKTNNGVAQVIDTVLVQGESNSGTGKVLKLSISLVTSAVLAMMLLN